MWWGGEDPPDGAGDTASGEGEATVAQTNAPAAPVEETLHNLQVW